MIRLTYGLEDTPYGIPFSWRGYRAQSWSPIQTVCVACVHHYLQRAWTALKTYLLENEPDWESVQVVRPPDQLKTMWWMLTHIQLDGAYHTGQASYLKMLLASR